MDWDIATTRRTMPAGLLGVLFRSINVFLAAEIYLVIGVENYWNLSVQLLTRPTDNVPLCALDPPSLNISLTDDDIYPAGAVLCTLSCRPTCPVTNRCVANARSAGNCSLCYVVHATCRLSTVQLHHNRSLSTLQLHAN